MPPKIVKAWYIATAIFGCITGAVVFALTEQRSELGITVEGPIVAILIAVTAGWIWFGIGWTLQKIIKRKKV